MGSPAGTAALVGCAVAALVWAGEQRLWGHAPSHVPGSNAPWAQWNRLVVQDGQPFIEGPSGPLPRHDATGRTAGFQTDWAGRIQPMTVDATMDVNVVATSLGSFTLDQPTIPLARVLDTGPPMGLFVATGRALFAV